MNVEKKVNILTSSDEIEESPRIKGGKLKPILALRKPTSASRVVEVAGSASTSTLKNLSPKSNKTQFYYS